MPQRYPVAYIRRSSSDANDPGDASREGQVDAVRELAARDGHNGDLRILDDDWGRSADEAKESRRKDFLRMLGSIERDEVSVVYAYALDRLYRSMRTFVRLTDAAKAHDVRIVTLREGVLGGDRSPMAQAFAQITAVFSELELNTTKARMGAINRVLADRDQHRGRVGYGYRLRRGEGPRGLARDAKGATIIEPDPDRPLEPVLQAVRDAGSIFGACKLLNTRGVPVPQKASAERRHGSAHWHPTPLRKIVERNAPELLPPLGPTRRRQPTNALLAQLLVCHCGHVLTPGGRRRYGKPAYRCTVGNRVGREAHGPLWVREAEVLPWIRDEVAHLRLDFDAVEIATGAAAQRAELTARLDRANDLYIGGKITRERYDAEDAAVTRALSALGEPDAIVEVTPVSDDEWATWNPGDLNGYLRALLREVRLGPDLRPVEAIWRNPALRA